MGEAAWNALSAVEQAHTTRVHKVDCSNHMRNWVVAAMSKAMSAYVRDALANRLNEFSSFERMTTDFDQLLRAVYKEFHEGGRYYKGKGRQFWTWMLDNYPQIFYLHFERADGGRQDLDYDAAVSIYILRPYMVEFLHKCCVFSKDHSNILEDFLYVTLTSVEFIAMARANAIVDLLLICPMRFLAGNGSKLECWSPAKANAVFDLMLETLEKGEADGHYFLNPSLDIFASVAADQPLFQKHRNFLALDSRKCLDGSARHQHRKLALQEVLTPADTTNQRSLTLTVEYLEVQCEAGLKKMRDPKLALAAKLDSLDGAESFENSSQMHEDLKACHCVNDPLAEAIFGIYDNTLRQNPGISMEAASAVAQARHSKVTRLPGDCVRHRVSKKQSTAQAAQQQAGQSEPGEQETSSVAEGFLYTLPREELVALVEYAHSTRKEMRTEDRKDHTEYDEYVKQKVKSNSELELAALIKAYALALSFFSRWKARGIRSIAAMRTAVQKVGEAAAADKRDANQAQLDWLREQIEMRVRGLGFEEFETHWSSSSDQYVGTVEHLKGVLEDIINEERERDSCRDLPTHAVCPSMRRKTYKELGTPTVQVELLKTETHTLSAAELLAAAEAELQQLEAAGEVDRVADAQPKGAPPLDASLVGKSLEIRWRYWEKDATKKSGRHSYYIWCEGKVDQVADGVIKASPRCKKPLKAGAVRVRWPADAERNEPEHFTWTVLDPVDWTREVHQGWRWAECELRTLACEK